MPRFAHTSYTATGERSNGWIDAENLQAARWALAEQGLRPERLLETSNDTGFGSQADGKKNSGLFQGTRSVHVELTLRQLAVMLRSGLTLLSSLETVIDQPPSRSMGGVYRRIRQQVEAGVPFSETLAEHSCFPKSVTSMIGLGEASGNLEDVLIRCAETMESSRRNKNAVLTALFYPMFTFLFAIGISVYMVIGVIPPMQLALEALGRPLPQMTQSLLDVADFLRAYGLTILIIIFSVGLAIFGISQWPPSRLALDRFILRLPLVGVIVRTSSTALFSRLLATLIRSGITLVESLRILGSIHSNHYFAKVVDDAREQILQGGQLAEGLDRVGAYTPMMIRMVGVGEASGNLEDTLLNVAEFHEERLQTLIKQLSAVLEPVIVLLVGLLVGYVYIAFFVALYGAV